MSCEKVVTDTSKSQFYSSFWRSNLVSCEKVAADTSKSQFYRSNCDRNTSKLQFYRSFWRSNLISCEKVVADTSKSQFYCSFWAIEPRFLRKGCVSCRLVGTAVCLKREIETKEKEEDREQEGKRARGQERT